MYTQSYVPRVSRPPAFPPPTTPGAPPPPPIDAPGELPVLRPLPGDFLSRTTPEGVKLPLIREVEDGALRGRPSLASPMKPLGGGKPVSGNLKKLVIPPPTLSAPPLSHSSPPFAGVVGSGVVASKGEDLGAMEKQGRTNEDKQHHKEPRGWLPPSKSNAEPSPTKTHVEETKKFLSIPRSVTPQPTKQSLLAKTRPTSVFSPSGALASPPLVSVSPSEKNKKGGFHLPLTDSPGTSQAQAHRLLSPTRAQTDHHKSSNPNSPVSLHRTVSSSSALHSISSNRPKEMLVRTTVDPDIPQPDSARKLMKPFLEKMAKGKIVQADGELSKQDYQLNFDEMDTDWNMYFMEETEEGENGPVTKKVLRLATFSKLIEKLTSADEHVSIDTFLLSYRSFSSPLQFFEALVQRYNYAIENEQIIVKLKTFNVFKHWIISCWDDFSQDEQISFKTLNFLSTLTKPDELKFATDLIGRLLNGNQPTQVRTVCGIPSPEPLVPDDTNIDIIYFPIVEIARQLIIIDWKYWTSIRPWEFLDLRWTKKNKRENSPNIIASCEFFNYISNWVATRVLLTEDAKERYKVVKRFIDLAMALKTMGNFNGMMMVWSGLNRGPVHRLKGAFQKLSKKYSSKLTEIENLSDRTGNYKQLRSCYQTADPPIIPYLGTFLTDMTFIEEGNKTIMGVVYDEKVIKMINYGKSRLLSELLSKIKLYQNKPYNFQTVKVMQEKLKNLKIISDEEVLYKLSEYYEPRGRSSKSRPDILNSVVTAPNIVHMPNMDFRLELTDSWVFGQPDSPFNIKYDLTTQQISAASLPKIVERLTHHQTPDTSSVFPFICSLLPNIKEDLLLLLINRYSVPDPQDKSPQNMERFIEFMKNPITRNVIEFLKIWLTYFWSDFSDNDKLLQLLAEFISGPLDADKKSSKRLSIIIEKKQQGEVLFTRPPPPLYRASQLDANQATVTSFEPQEIARQLLILSTKLFSRVQPRKIEEEPPYLNPTSLVYMLFEKNDYEEMVLQFKLNLNKKKKKKPKECTFTGHEACLLLVNAHNITNDEAIECLKYLQIMGVIDSTNPEAKLEFADSQTLFRLARKSFNLMNHFSAKRVFNFELLPGMGPLRQHENNYLSCLKNWVIEEIENAYALGINTSVELYHFIQVAKEVLKQKDWLTLQGLVAGLNEIHHRAKLKSVWEGIQAEDTNWLLSTRSIFLSFHSLHKKMTSHPLPVVPCLSVHIDKIYLMNKFYGKVMENENLINFKRHVQIGKQLEIIVRSQSIQTNFEVVPIIQQYLAKSFKS